MTGSEVLRPSAPALTDDLTPDRVAVGGVQLTQIKTLVWREEPAKIHENQSTALFLHHQRSHKLTLTSGVFQPADGIGKETNATQEACPLPLVDLFMVPYTDGDRVCLSNVATNQTRGVY